MRLLAPLLLALLLVPAGLQARPQAPAAQQEDGPYVLWDGPKARVLRQRQGTLQEAPLPASGLLDLPSLPPLPLSALAPAPAPAEFPLPSRLAAFSDAHGNYASLVKLLTAQGILSKDLRWAFGKGHLVGVGDMVDRGGQVTEILWLLRSLERQAKAAGGGVHVLLGNHETMNMKGDLRYVNAKYLALSQPIATLLGPASEQGRWLRSLPVMARFGDILFVHGGPSPAFAASGRSLAEVNTAARQELAAEGKGGPVLGNTGPLWYRGLIPGAAGGAGPSDAEVAALLKAYRATSVVVGHTTPDHVTVFHGGLVTGIDAGLKDGQPGELWLQIDGKRYRGLADGTRVPLTGEPASR
jgi:hypothetical protein